jgi:hypothetical protein
VARFGSIDTRRRPPSAHREDAPERGPSPADEILALQQAHGNRRRARDRKQEQSGVDDGEQRTET